MIEKTPPLVRHLRPGKVYRRKHLEAHSTSIDRDLQRLVQEGVIKKAAPGLYYRPKTSRFGELPPDDHQLIQAFLDTNDFLAFSPNILNTLGLGSTQLSNTIRVYNHKRHGLVTLAGKTYDFRMRPQFPKQLTEEFLVVEFLNESRTMAEEIRLTQTQIREKIKRLDKSRLDRIIKQFGKLMTRKIYALLTADTDTSPSPRPS